MISGEYCARNSRHAASGAPDASRSRNSTVDESRDDVGLATESLHDTARDVASSSCVTESLRETSVPLDAARLHPNQTGIRRATAPRALDSTTDLQLMR
jgi:hypothetical protein